MELKSGHINVDIRDSIGIIEICDEKTMNSMTLDMVADLIVAVKHLNAHPDIRCGIITGAGQKSFTSGGNLKAEERYANKENENIDRFNRMGMELVDCIWNGKIPYIASVNGYALGAALAIIAACDLAYGSESSLYGMPTPSLGGIPGWGCTQLVTRLIGRHAVHKMLLLNEKIGAEEAQQMGILNAVYPVEELRGKTMEAAERIAGYAPNTMCAIKKMVNDGLDMDVFSAIEMEAQYLYSINTKDNFVRGINAFMRKEMPEFDMTKE